MPTQEIRQPSLKSNIPSAWRRRSQSRQRVCNSAPARCGRRHRPVTRVYQWAGRVCDLATHLRQALRDGRCDLPKVSRLVHQHGASPQGREKMAPMDAKILPKVFVCGQLDVCTADFHGDNFFSAQRGREATTTHGALRGECIVQTGTPVDHLMKSCTLGEAMPLWYAVLAGYPDYWH